MSVTPTPITTKLPPFPAGPPQELLLSSAFLIKRLGMMIKESSLAALEPTGLTHQHHAVLTLLDEGVRETQGEIADTLGYDRSHLVGLLDELRAISKKVEKELLAPLDAEERRTLHTLLLQLTAHHDPRCAFKP